jgi:hypothetical protein
MREQWEAGCEGHRAGLGRAFVPVRAPGHAAGFVLPFAKEQGRLLSCCMHVASCVGRPSAWLFEGSGSAERSPPFEATPLHGNSVTVMLFPHCARDPWARRGRKTSSLEATPRPLCSPDVGLALPLVRHLSIPLQGL